jgi:hypothetical protein
MVRSLLPSTLEPRTSVVLLLRPEQAAWLRAHAGRRGVSAFMRSLLDHLMETERREIERLRQGLPLAKGPADAVPPSSVRG